MSKKRQWLNNLGVVAIVGSLLMYLFASNESFQMVDGPQRARSMECDGKDHILKFQNFVTAHSWMERIRWDKAGSYSIGMEFDIGKEVALSYRCQKPDTSISPVL